MPGPQCRSPFLVAAIACTFAGLCYAEMASAVPVAGSAYTYSYATMGELVAWIIGWDLVLEYAEGAATVGVGWSGYLVSLLDCSACTFRPPHLGATPLVYRRRGEPSGGRTAPTTGWNLDRRAASTCRRCSSSRSLSTILVIGIKESAKVNNLIVILKVAVVLLFVAFGLNYVNPANWHPFIPPNTGDLRRVTAGAASSRGAGLIFFAYIGFDAVSHGGAGSQEPAAGHAHRHPRLAGHLHHAVRPGLAVLTGMVRYTELNVAHPVAYAVEKVGAPHWARVLIDHRRGRGPRVGGAGHAAGPKPGVLLDVARRAAGPLGGQGASPFPDALSVTIYHRYHRGDRHRPVAVRSSWASWSTSAPCSPSCWSASVSWCSGRPGPTSTGRSGRRWVPFVPIMGIICCLGLMATLPADTWLRLIVWLLIGFVIYFGYGRKHSVLQREREAQALRKTRERTDPSLGAAAEPQNPNSLFRRKSVTALQAGGGRGPQPQAGTRPAESHGARDRRHHRHRHLRAHRHGGGPERRPRRILSFVLAGTASVFAALCYSEFASLVPMAGSAYTYGYATLGELVAWIIGWDLVLEYALAATTVAIGWSGYMVSFLADIGIHIPAHWQAARGTVVTLADGSTTTAILNLPAVLIIAVVTTLLVVGIKESASVNNVIVFIKLTVVLLFIVLAAPHVNPDNWHPFIPPNTGHREHFGFSGVVAGAAIVFFAYIGFDAVSTAAQEAKNPQRDMPIGILGSLVICTVLYIIVSAIADRGRALQRARRARPDRQGGRLPPGSAWLCHPDQDGRHRRPRPRSFWSSCWASRGCSTRCPGWLLPPFVRRIHPRFRTPYITSIITGVAVAIPAAILPVRDAAKLVSIGTLLAFVIVCTGVLVLRIREPNLHRPVQDAVGLVRGPDRAALSAAYLMVYLDKETWIRLLVWLVIGLAIYFPTAGAIRCSQADGKLKLDARVLVGLLVFGNDVFVTSREGCPGTSPLPRALEPGQRVCLTTHVNPDGDGLGQRGRPGASAASGRASMR